MAERCQGSIVHVSSILARQLIEAGVQAERLVRKAAHDGAQVVCLPELFRSQYFCQSEDTATFDLAEPIPGPGVISRTQAPSWSHQR